MIEGHQRGAVDGRIRRQIGVAPEIRGRLVDVRIGPEQAIQSRPFRKETDRASVCRVSKIRQAWRLVRCRKSPSCVKRQNPIVPG